MMESIKAISLDGCFVISPNELRSISRNEKDFAIVPVHQG